MTIGFIISMSLDVIVPRFPTCPTLPLLPKLIYTARAALPRFKLTHNFADDLGWLAADVDGDRMLIWRGFLQRRKLAVEQANRHEVLVPGRHTPAG